MPPAVVIATDEDNADVVIAAVAGCGLGGRQVRLEAFSASTDWGMDDEERLGQHLQP